MAINFPTSPSTNDTFTAGSITYKWDGAKWIGLGVTPTDRLIDGSNSLEITSTGQLLATSTADVRLTLGSYGTAGTNDSVHIRADGSSLLFMNGNGGITKFESNGTETLQINSSGQLITKGRIFIKNTNAGFDYNPIANTLEVLITDGSTHSEFNSGAFVPAGSKNLGAPSLRWNNVYANTVWDSVGPLRTLGAVTKSVDYTPVYTDAGKMIMRTGGNVTISYDGAFNQGDMFTILNTSSSSMSIIQGSENTLYNTADGTTGNRTLASRGSATVVYATGGFYISGTQLT